MGYFSEKAIEIEERAARSYDWSYPSRIDRLQFQLEDLQDRLAELEEIRPHDPLDPLYDRYFYEDYIAHYNESPNTVQGLLRAIREVKELIRVEEEKQNNHSIFYLTALLTGADQDGQCVLLDAFAPPASGWLTIAA